MTQRKGRGDRLIRPIRLRSGQDFRPGEALNRHGPAAAGVNRRYLKLHRDRHEQQHVTLMGVVSSSRRRSIKYDPARMGVRLTKRR